MAIGTFANLSPAQIELAQRRSATVNPLDSLIQGFNTGQALQQLPAQQVQQALMAQLQTELLRERLLDARDPNRAIAREFQKQLAVQSLNPASGIIRATPGDEGLTIATPVALTPEEQVFATTPGLIPTVGRPTGTPITPVLGVTGQPTGFMRDPNAPRAAREQTLDDQIRLINARTAAGGTSGRTIIDETGTIQFIPSRILPGQVPTATAVTGASGAPIKAQPKGATSKQASITPNQQALILRRAGEAGIDPDSSSYLNDETGDYDFTKLSIDSGKAIRENKRLEDATKGAALTGDDKKQLTALNSAEKQLHTLQNEILEIAKSGKTPSFLDNMIAADLSAPPTGWWSSAVQQTESYFQSPESKNLEDRKAVIASGITKAISGLAVSKDEARRLGFLPRAGESFQDLMRKAENLQDYINNQREGIGTPRSARAAAPIATDTPASAPIKINSIRLKP